METRVFATGLVSVTAIVLAVAAAQAQTTVPVKACPDPAAPCISAGKNFAPYELTFKLPDRIKPNVEYLTVPFQAVILLTFPKYEPGGEECDGGEFSTKIEALRQDAQKLFPNRKVFAGYQCPDMGAVIYTMKGKPYNTFFVAVYGGETPEEAKQVLAKAKGKFHGAVLKPMQAVFSDPEE